jgi:phosphatidylglycerol:prolipoprotein diacylglycerol transferase
LHPSLFKFHSFEVHSYGLMLAIAFLVAIQIFIARGKRRGISEDSLHTVSLVILVLSIVGGRGLFVLTHWPEYSRDLLGIFRLWEGGLMLYGGYILAIVGSILYVRRAKLSVWRVGDAVAPAMVLGIGIGRIGCFLNGCCFGLPTGAPWGVQFPAGSYSAYTFPGVPIHPSQLYLAAAGFVVFTVLLVLDRKPRFDGFVFWTAVALDSIMRFGIDFTRYYDETSHLGQLGGLSFNINQVLSAGLLVTSGIMLRVLSRRRAASPAADDGPSVEPGANPAPESARSAAAEPRSTL